MKAFLFFIFFTTICFAQDRKMLSGKVSTLHESKETIRVTNETTKEVVYTNGRGSYQIKVKLNDVLAFYNDEFIEQRITISEPILNRNKLDVFLSSNNTVLKELLIDKRDTLNAALGFSKLDMTPAEKALYGSKQIAASGDGITGVKIDGLINRITGRRKMLDTWLHMETNETNVNKFKQVFPNAYIVEHFKIKPADVNLFIYTIVEQPDFELLNVQQSIPYLQFLEGHAQEFRKAMKYGN